MLVIEGPDGSGKSTLVKRLLQDLDIEFQPRVVSKDAEAMVDLLDWTSQDLQKGFGRRLYDRHRLISELIYGPMLRGKMEPGFDDPTWLATKLYKFWRLEPIVILCLPPLVEVLCNVKEDDANRVVWEKATSIYWLYYVWWCQHKDQCYLWDYMKGQPESYDILVKSVKFELERKCG